MKKENTSQSITLRQKAEEQLKNKRSNSSSELSESDSLKLLHELEVNKIELQMQDEEFKLEKEHSDRTLNIAMEAADMAWWEIEMATGNVTFNKRKAEMLGYSPERFKHYQDFMALVHPEDYDKAMNALQKHIDGLIGKYEVEYRILVNSGEYKWFYDIGSVVEKDSKGIPVLITGFSIHISERKLIEQQLLESEYNLRERVKELNGLFSLGLVIEKFEKLEDIYIEFVNVIVPESMQFPEKVYASLEIEGKTYCNIENFKLLENQKYLSAPITLFGMQAGELIVAYTKELLFIEFYEQNLINQFASRISKTAALRKSQFTLNESNNFNSQIINSAREGIIVYDRNLKIQVWNPFMEKLSGFHASEIIGKYPLDVFPFLKEAGLIDILEKALNGEIGNDIDFPFFISTTGKTGWASDSAAPLYDSKNEIIGVISTVRDITERKHSEIELIKAKEKAEESDRLKSAFLSNMSHEIRIPLNGILGFTDLLRKPNLTGEKQQEFIEIIEKSSARMLNTMNNIIDMSKIESGLMQVNLTESNINEQIQFVYSLFKPEAEKKGLQLYIKNGLPAEVAIIKTDREKIYAILINLIKNAIKYTEKGSIIFGYNIKKSKDFNYSQHSHFLEFYVKDSGVGIPKDRQEAIFERFIQADIGDKRAFQGSGLGLSISKSYLEMLEGMMWVESEQGKGTVFYFTIPYNVVATEKNAIKNVISKQEKGILIKKLKILIAEDDEWSKRLFTLHVGTLCKAILFAKTGAEAIESCRNNPDIDLVLMDIQMSEMDGYDATRRIRQFNKDVIIIAQTAYGFSSDKKMAIEAGCNDYITKPVTKNELLALIQKYLKK